ncbi:flagellar protein FlgN [Caldicellulosiruptor naganoensis]|uniref:Flagellar protein FlgN n=1 Tax=Caldicellulosiruptor naganoensis TaxID=29324 RepID=A0ABY7BEK7_9FIRM|nr:flagellar protein FlgN [Caldicellulosiruptor naganoensis]WAM30853.1 flagellar protein FlgN [Caldicellulosiruptor naganoensis]
MNQDVNSVIEILEKEHNILREILELCNSKTKFIVENNISALIEQSTIEKQKAEEINKLEDLRQSLIAKISKEKSTEISSLDNLVEFCKDEQKQKLIDIKNSISKVVSEIKRVNDLNLRLIQSSLEYIDFMTNLISSYFTDDTTYQKNGQSKITKKNLFDVKL